MSVRRKLKMFVESINRSSSVSDLAETAWLIGDSSLHTAIYKGNEQELQILVNNINPAERLNTFLLKNRNSFTLLDEAVNERNASVVKFVLNSLPDDNDRFLLIQSRGCRGWTTLHRAVQTQNESVLKAILNSVAPACRKDLVEIPDRNGSIILLQSLLLADHSMFKCILSALPLDHSPLRWKDADGNSILHLVALKQNAELLQWILEREPKPEVRLKLIKSVDEDGRNLMHIAAENSDIKTVRCILGLLESPNMKFDLLWTRDKYSRTVIHYAAKTDDDFSSNNIIAKLTDKFKGHHTSIIESLLDAVPLPQRIALLKIQDCLGSTALHEAQRIHNTHAISVILKSVDVASVHHLWQQSTITSAEQGGHSFTTPGDNTSDEGKSFVVYFLCAKFVTISRECMACFVTFELCIKSSRINLPRLSVNLHC